MSHEAVLVTQIRFGNYIIRRSSDTFLPTILATKRDFSYLSYAHRSKLAQAPITHRHAFEAHLRSPRKQLIQRGDHDSPCYCLGLPSTNERRNGTLRLGFDSLLTPYKILKVKTATCDAAHRAFAYSLLSTSAILQLNRRD